MAWNVRASRLVLMLNGSRTKDTGRDVAGCPLAGVNRMLADVLAFAAEVLGVRVTVVAAVPFCCEAASHAGMPETVNPSGELPLVLTVTFCAGGLDRPW